MSWFNYIGLIIIILLMIPNIIAGIKNKESFINYYKNKIIETLEQIGRFGCFIFMIFNIPYLYFNFWFNNALLVYIIVNAVLLILYFIIWIICFKKHIIFRSYALSIIPSIMFLFSGIMVLSIPLILLSVVFSFAHITISLQNGYAMKKNNNKE